MEKIWFDNYLFNVEKMIDVMKYEFFVEMFEVVVKCYFDMFVYINMG